jgi:NADP-dependent 3-hydroxy acid dehydrogenase YdfG/acyl carrier protein
MMTSRLLELTGTMRKGESLFIPMRLERLTLWNSPPEAILCFSNARRGGQDSVMEGDALARDAEGRAVLEVAGCLTRQTNREAMLRELRRDGEGLLYHLLWREAPPVSAAAVKTGREAVACLRLGDGPPPPELARLPRAPETNIAAFLAGTDGKPVLVLAHLPGTARDAGREMREAAGLWRILRDCANASSPPRLHLLTRGLAAEADGPGETGGAGLAGASLPGLAASFALEHPGLLVSVIDLPLVPERGDYSRALDYCLSLGDALAEPASLALRRGKILSCRLAAAKPPRRTADVDYSGTHLVSGGTGALGLKTALWLAEHGAACLALLSRSGGSAGALAETAQRVRAAGCRLLTLKGDVSDEGDLRAALARVRAEAPPLRGVFHAAGARDDGLLINLSEERLLRVLRPKIQGAILLDRLTREDGLNFFVCYSSAGSLLGSGGQAAYNAANHFLNALCRARRRDGLAAAAPCFGPWAEGGMADDARVGANLRQQGIRPLSGGDALSAMFAGLAGPSAVYGIMDMDWPLFASRRNIDPRGFFSLAAARTPGPAAKPVEAGASAPIDFFAGARRADGGLDRAATLEGLRRQVASLLGQGDFTLIAPDKPIMDYGFDSLMAVRFSDAVGKALGLRVPVSVAFELPTLDKICAWLCAKAGQDQAAGPAEKTAPSPERLGPAKRPGWLSALFDGPP